MKPVHAVLSGILRQTWVLLLLVTVAAMAATVWDHLSGSAIAAPLWEVFLIAVVGLVGSYAVHETAHVLLLQRICGPESVRVERTALRMSVTSAARPRGWALARVAAAGPSAAVGTGVALFAIPAIPTAAAAIHMLHIVFLLPCFGDGRALLIGFLARGKNDLGGTHPAQSATHRPACHRARSTRPSSQTGSEDSRTLPSAPNTR